MSFTYAIVLRHLGWTFQKLLLKSDFHNFVTYSKGAQKPLLMAWRLWLWSLKKITLQQKTHGIAGELEIKLFTLVLGPILMNTGQKSLFLQNGFHRVLLTGSIISPWILDRIWIFKLSSPSLGSCRGLGSSDSLEEFRMAAVEDIPEAERTQIFTKKQKFEHFSKLWKSISPRLMGLNRIQKFPPTRNYIVFLGKIHLAI